mmetsp:Transcript_86039/g.221541  ORF Transcript_86039/g.221541 Transcript_86039/m.221541 type:complete len:372 (-) Transcript_86039:42-1157(-)
MAAATQRWEAFCAVKNTFLHFDDDLGELPEMRRRGSRAKTEPAVEPWAERRYEESETNVSDSNEQYWSDTDSEPRNNAATDLRDTERRNGRGIPSPAGTPAVQHVRGAFVPGPIEPCMRPPVQQDAWPPAAPAAMQQHHLPLQRVRATPGYGLLLEAEEQMEDITPTIAGKQSRIPAPATCSAQRAAPQRAAQTAEGCRWTGAMRHHVAQPAASSQALPRQALQLCQEGDAIVLYWAVDAKKLRGSDKGLVSPPFDLPFPEPTPFKIMLVPRGGMSFGKAGGKGSIVLKCGIAMGQPVDSARIIRYRLIGSEASNASAFTRGPIRHDFSQNGVCNLPKDQQEWDFSQAVHDKSQTVTVCIEIQCCSPGCSP